MSDYRHLRSAEDLFATEADENVRDPVQEQPQDPPAGGDEVFPTRREPLLPLRDWDVIVTAEAPGLTPEEIDFSVLEDGTIVVDGEGSGDASPLADAVERRLRPPYRAHGLVQAGRWTVLARGVRLVRFDDPAEQLELAVNGGERRLLADGEEASRRVPALEALGAGMHEGFFVRAVKVDEGIWEAEVTPL